MDKILKRRFSGLPELSWLLLNKDKYVMYGESRRDAIFTCAECGHSCVCCDEAKIYTLSEIIRHINDYHSP